MATIKLKKGVEVSLVVRASSNPILFRRMTIVSDRDMEFYEYETEHSVEGFRGFIYKEPLPIYRGDVINAIEWKKNDEHYQL